MFRRAAASACTMLLLCFLLLQTVAAACGGDEKHCDARSSNDEVFFVQQHALKMAKAAANGDLEPRRAVTQVHSSFTTNPTIADDIQEIVTKISDSGTSKKRQVVADDRVDESDSLSASTGKFSANYPKYLSSEPTFTSVASETKPKNDANVATSIFDTSVKAGEDDGNVEFADGGRWTKESGLQLSSSEQQSYGIVMPTYPEHFHFVVDFLRSYDDLGYDRVPIGLVFQDVTDLAAFKNEVSFATTVHGGRLQLQTNEAFNRLLDSCSQSQSDVWRYMSSASDPSEVVQLNLVSLDTLIGEPVEFKQKYHFQALKKLYGALAFGFTWSWFVDSEAMLLSRTSIRGLFDAYVKHPYVFVLEADDRNNGNPQAREAESLLGIESTNLDFWENTGNWFFTYEALCNFVKRAEEVHQTPLWQTPYNMGFLEVIGPWIYQYHVGSSNTSFLVVETEITKYGLMSDFLDQEQISENTGRTLRRPLSLLTTSGSNLDAVLGFMEDVNHPIQAASLSTNLADDEDDTLVDMSKLPQMKRLLTKTKVLNVSLFGEGPRCFRESVLTGGQTECR